MASCLYTQHIRCEINFERFIPFYKKRMQSGSQMLKSICYDLIWSWSKREFRGQLVQPFQSQFSPTLQIFIKCLHCSEHF